MDGLYNPIKGRKKTREAVMRRLEEYLELAYTIETKREADGSYFIRVKELPGCMSVGDSIEDAYAMIEDAKADWIAFCLEDGRAVPEPEDEAVMTPYAGLYMVPISASLHRALAECAHRRRVSLHHLADELLSRAIEAETGGNGS